MQGLNIKSAQGMDLGDTPLAVWPDNWRGVQVFRRLTTQWNVSMGGVVGLRYEALPVVLEACRIPRRAWGEVLDCIGIMERAALARMNKQG